MIRDFERFNGFNDGIEVAEGFGRSYMRPLHRRFNWRYGRTACRCGQRGCRCGRRFW